jgi:hypothetical protein
MLSKLYVDNFKCFVNFEFAAQPVQLVLGLNGAGKSSLLDVLALLRDFVNGDGRTDDLFPADTLTRWQNRRLQTFEMGVEGNGGHYLYRLEIDHHQIEAQQNRVYRECLTFDGGLLFDFKLGEVQLYRDDFSRGPKFKFDWKQSGLGALGSRQDNRRLAWFRDWLENLYVVRMNPFAMHGNTEHERSRPLKDMSDFAAWYLHLIPVLQDLPFELKQSLNELWETFEGFRFDKVGKTASVLRAKFAAPGDDTGEKAADYAFDELSEGQRVLIVLYTLLHFASRTPDLFLGIDEAQNYMALAEIQPWLSGLVDAAEEHGFQVLLASHHPELINYLAPDRCVRLVRERGGPTRVLAFSAEPGSRLTPAETVARGWENG